MSLHYTIVLNSLHLSYDLLRNEISNFQFVMSKIVFGKTMALKSKPQLRHSVVQNDFQFEIDITPILRMHIHI